MIFKEELLNCQENIVTKMLGWNVTRTCFCEIHPIANTEAHYKQNFNSTFKTSNDMCHRDLFLISEKKSMAFGFKTERVSACTMIWMSSDPAGDYSSARFVLLLCSFVFSMQVITPHSLRLTQSPCAQIIMPLLVKKKNIKKMVSNI